MKVNNLRNIPTNFSESFTVLDDFTKTELKILRSFMWFFKERLMGNHKETFPSIQTIADMSKCSKRSVDYFIKRYDNVIISHRHDNCINNKFNPNKYEFCQEFFENAILLDECGYLKRWSKDTRIHVLKLYIKNEWFLHEILYKRGDLSTTNLRTGFWQKLRTIKNFYSYKESINNKYLHKVPIHIDKQQNQPVREAPQDLCMNLMDGIPVYVKQKVNIARNFGYIHIRKGVEAYHYKKTKEQINNPAAFIWNVCRKSSMESMNRKTK